MGKGLKLVGSMILIKRILILEDNYAVLCKLLEKLSLLEDKQPFQFSLTILNDSDQIENLIHDNPKAKFDIILLDRDCKVNKSFHALNIEDLGVEKVIAISAIPEFNKQLKDRGVRRVVEKNLSHPDEFAAQVVEEIEKMIQKLPWE